MENLKFEEISEAIKQFEYYDNYIKKAKEEIRKLSKEEVKEINKTTCLHIDRQPQTNYTYSAEYKAEVEKIKAKFPPEKEVIEDYKIKLTTQNVAIIRKTEELQKLANNNITTLRKMSASVNKSKRK